MNSTSKILMQAVTDWLRGEASSELGILAALRNRGISVQAVSEYLAMPEVTTQKLVALHSALEQAIAEYQGVRSRATALIDEERKIFSLSEPAFRENCAAIGGTIQPSGEEGGIICHYKRRSGQPKPQLDTYANQKKALIVELEKLKAESSKTLESVMKAGEAKSRLVAEMKAAEAVADVIKRGATYMADLDSVLRSVVMSSEATSSKGSIQTPTVVLSRNEVEAFSVGGHNIDALPWEVKPGKTSSLPYMQVERGRPQIVAPAAQLDNSNSIARVVAARSDPADLPKVDTLQSLGLSERPAGTLLERMRAQENVLPDAGIAKRAKLCKCDVYVERGEGSTATIVRLKPPPSSRTVFGTGALIETLSAETGRARTIFAGYSPSRAAAISEGAIRLGARTVREDAGFAMKVHLDVAKDAFETGAAKLMEVAHLSTAGRRYTAATATRGELSKLLAQRPPWKSATFETASERLETNVLVEVKFHGAKSGEISEIRAVAVSGDRASMVKPLSVKGDILGRRITAGNPDVSEATARLAKTIYESDKDVARVDFVMRTAGTTEARIRSHERIGMAH